MSKWGWLTESVMLSKSDPFVRENVRDATAYRSSEKMELAKFLRRVNIEPKEPTYDDVLRILSAPVSNDQTPFSAYKIRPTDILINRAVSPFPSGSCEFSLSGATT